MRFNDTAFRLAASKGQLGQLKAMYILNPEVLHATEVTSGKNALDFAVEYEQKEVVQWLQSVGAAPTNPTTLGSLILFMDKVNLSTVTAGDNITVDNITLLMKRAFEGLSLLEKRFGKDVDVVADDENITFKEVVGYFKIGCEDVYINNKESSIDSLYVIANFLVNHIQRKIKNIGNENVILSKDEQNAAAWIGLLSSVVMLDFIRLQATVPSFKKALQLHSIPKVCSLIQIMLSDFEDYVIEHASDADVIELEHVSVQAHHAHAIAKASARPNIIFPIEAADHIKRLNQQSEQKNGAFHGMVLAAKDYEGTRQSTESVVKELVMAAVQIKKGELPRTQFIVYIGKNSHAMTVDISWNKDKLRFEAISFDMIEASQQLQFLNNFKTQLNQRNSDVVIAACNTNLQKDYDSCGLYAIKLSKLSAKLTFSQCLAMKDPTTPFGKIIQFNAHHLGEKVIRMGQSVSEMRENLQKLYPNDPQVIQGLVQYDALKHLAHMRSKTAMFKDMQGIEQKMRDLTIETQANPDLAGRLNRIKQKFEMVRNDYQRQDLEALSQVLGQWQENAQKAREKFDYQQSIMKHTLAVSAGSEFVFQGKTIAKMVLLQSGKAKDEFHASLNRFILKFADNSYQVFDLKTDNEPDEKVRNINKTILAQTCFILQNLGAVVDDSFFNVSNRRILSWKVFTFERMYTVASFAEPLQKFYRAAHLDVAERIGRLVQSRNPIPKEVTLFSFGCGDGKELPLAHQKLTDAGVVVKGFGFDINPTSYQKAASENKALIFAQGDVLNLEHSISQQKFNTHSFKIGMFIGVLTESVLGGTLEALKAIQQTRALDYLYVEGWNRVLLNKKVLKAAGFVVSVGYPTDAMIEYFRAVNDNHIKPIRFELSWMTDPQRVDYLQTRSIARSRNKELDMLDLSFSANPLRDLKLFENSELEKIKSIDISWSYLKENEVDEFFKLLAQIKTTKLILIVSSAQIAFDNIMNAASPLKHVFVHERNDAANLNEIPAFMPKEAKRWGIYDQLPNRRLKRQLT